MHSRSDISEHRVAVFLLLAFVAALAVRLAGKSGQFRRLLRKHAGGTQALVLFEKCLDYLNEPGTGQTRSPRRTSKPG